MKKILSIIISLTVLLAILSSCKTEKSVQNSNEKISVVTTIFPPYDFVREIAKDNVNLDILLKAGQESHSYEPTAKDIIKIQNSNLFIYTGSENDFWVEKVLESLDKTKTKVLKLVDMVDTLSVEEENEHDHENEDEHEHEHEHSHGDIDEHVWTSPKNAMIISKTITSSLKELDSKNAQIYQQNLDAYINELSSLDKSFSDVVANAKRNTIVVGDRFPFRYLAHQYNIQYKSALDACQTNSDASPKTISSLIETVKNESIPVVLKIEMSSSEIANTIANDTNAKVLQMHSCHNLSKDEWDNNETYLSLMKKNVDILREALN